MLKDDFRVIEILDEYSLIINYGFSNGASAGDTIRIISIGPEIIDPVTERNLGTLDAIKAELEITTPYEHFSVCKKIETSESNALNPMDRFKLVSRKVVKLDIDNEYVSDKRFPKKEPIKIGDKVVVL